MKDFTSFIIIALIFVSIGFILGVLVSSLRGEKDDTGGGESPTDPELVEVARLWRHQSGEAFLEVDGRKYSSADDLSVGQQSQFSRILVNLRTWLELPEASHTAPGITPISSQMDIMTPAPSEPKQRPSISIVDSLARAIRPDVSGLQPEPQSIVAQIDEILQEELANTSLEKRAVRLLESPGEGMVVMVGLDKYDGVDAVPDAEIRGIIRAAAAKWEKRLGEG